MSLTELALLDGRRPLPLGDVIVLTLTYVYSIFMDKNIQEFTVAFIFSILKCMYWGVKEARRKVIYLYLRFVMVKMDQFNIISHNFAALNEDLIYSLSVRRVGITLTLFACHIKRT
jgi:hypothetical protein